MKRILPLAAVLVFGISGSAHASTLGVNLGNLSTDVTYGTAGPIIPNINLATYSGLVLNNNSLVVDPATSVLNQYIEPTGPVFANNFLAVLGNPDSGHATFTLVPGQHSFSFTWGSIDDFNTLLLTDSRSVTYHFTGADILANLAGSVEGQSQTDINFVDPFGTIQTAIFTSTSNSFEAANFGQSAVPLPPALPLFGAALLALAVFGHRRVTV